MGHLVGKDIYKKLGNRIDHLSVRVNQNEIFFKILKELYTREEAELLVKMPGGLTPVEDIEKITGYEISKLRKMLDVLCHKGLVVDLWIKGKYHYSLAPMIVGIFEFTMMRIGSDLNTKEWARLFHEYLEDGGFYDINFGKGERVSPIRALPHEGTILNEDFVEVLDYERATAIVEGADKFSIGICSCRHEKLHVDQKECDVPLGTCASFSGAADYLVRNNLAKEVSKSEMLENLARSKEMGLVFNADNVRNKVSFICQCCKCCCNVLRGISHLGYANTVVTSSFIAEVDQHNCIGCGKCAKACPIEAIEMQPILNPQTKKKKEPVINKDICIGCGVCALKCDTTNAMKLIKREKRVLHPENTFEKVLLQCLERGTLHHQLFDDPLNVTQKMLKGMVGGFLRLTPVKKALMSDTLRSSFLSAMKKGVAMQGKEWVLEL